MKYINRNKKAYILFEKDKKSRAIEIIKKLIDKNEDAGLNSLILYEIYTSMNNERDGISILENICKNLKNITYKAEILMILGKYHHKRSEYKKAYYYYKNALDINKEDEKVLFQLGLLYFDLKKTENAGKIFKYLYKKQKKDLFYKTLFALYLCESGNLLESKTLTKDVISEKQNFYPAYFVLGYIKFIEGEYKESIEDFDRAKHSIEFKFKALYFAGKAEMLLNNSIHASEYFKEAALLIKSENSTTLDLRYSLVLCFENNHDYHSALEQLRIIHKENPAYKDIAEKLISDNYKNLGPNHLIDYNTYSAEEFIRFGKRLLSSFSLEISGNRIINDNTFIFTAKINKSGIIHNILKKILDFSKSDRLLAVFSRSLPVKEEFLKNLVSDKKLDFTKCIIFSSGPVSPLALSYAYKNSMEIINPTQLDKIIQTFEARKPG